MEEIWKDIPGFEGFYQVSNLGRVKSIDRRVKSVKENGRFYKYCWNIYPHVCAECCKPLRQYSAVYISHIKTRGSHPALAHDCRNVNILCFEHHLMWENGNRERMRIYPGNQRIIKELLQDYNVERK